MDVSVGSFRSVGNQDGFLTLGVTGGLLIDVVVHPTAIEHFTDKVTWKVEDVGR